MDKCKSIITISLLVGLIISSFIFTNPNNSWAQTREVVVVYFEPDIDGIGPGNKEKIKGKVNSINNLSDASITLEGYSDITGRADYNLKLSKERAQIVKDYLLELGVDSGSIEVIGKGGTDKYASGETDEALARNRRVNVIIEISAQAEVQADAEEIVDTTEEEPSGEIQEAPEVSEVEEGPPTISLNEISGKIDRAIRQSASNGIVFSTPQEMKIGVSYTVEAEVSYIFIKELSEGLEGFRLGDQIGLMLSSDGLDISDEDLDIKTIDKESTSTWQWEVTPQTQGVKSLILSVAIASETTILDDTYPTYRRIIDVKPNMIHSITSSYLIMAILIVLIIAIVAWVLIRRVKVN